MLKKLRLKMTAATIISLMLVLGIIGGSLILGIYFNFSYNTDKTLRYIAENDGSLPPADSDEEEESIISDFGFGVLITPETPYETRYFTVKTDASGDVIFADISHVAEISVDEAEFFAERVMASRKNTGLIYQYKYLKLSDIGGGHELVFLNCTSTLRWIYSVISLLVTVMLFALVVTSLMVWMLSERIVSSFYVNLEAQKKFITNASHEIKTPIAIIDANAEVLKYTTGDNEWIESIQNQTKRLTHLTKRLIALSKAEERQTAGKMERFSLSDAVLDTAYSLKSTAEARGLVYTVDVEQDVTMKGDEMSMRQLTEVLVENAIKYCSDGGAVDVKVYSKGRSIYLETVNDCEGVVTEKLSALFDRFYRADDSRSRETGGFGIGLSIAKAVVTTHRGKIYAKKEGENKISFTAVFNNGFINI